MKKLVTLVFMALVTPMFAFAGGGLDTIDYWHVESNGRVIGKFNAASTDPAIRIKKADIKSPDTLSIDYRNDAPCVKCTTTLYIKDRSRRIVLAEEKGAFITLKISMFKLMSVLRSLNNSDTQIYYADKYRDLILFKIKLE